MPSENGWNPARANGATDCQWVRIPGAEHVSLQFLKGQPLKILRAYAADYHAYIEPLRDHDSASYTPTNSVATSNHLNGTAMDLNWQLHPFRVDYAGFDGPKIARMRDLLAFYNFEGLQIMFWAQDWRTPKDAMHHQLGYNTYGDPRVQRFIDQRIRSDGFSTYRRTGTPNLPPTSPNFGGNAADILARATGLSPARATEILPTVLDGLKLSDCTNVNRIAMWLAQMGHESAGFVYTEEIAKNGRYAPYIGRTWIQITWDYNYRTFSKWCHDRGLVPTPDYFVTNYRALADLKWAGIGPAWYWTVARPDINRLSDNGDIVTVTQRINGGQNGIADRRERYRRAINLGDQLLTLTAAADPFEEILTMNVKSWSIYATPGEPEIPVVDLIRAIDAKVHRDLTDEDARAGDPEAIRRVARTAAGLGANRSPGAINHAVAVLNEINATNPQAILDANPGRA
jgi:predicted chitinase